MKTVYQFNKLLPVRKTLATLIICAGMLTVNAQEETTTEASMGKNSTPIKRTFEHGVLINNQTIETNLKNELGFMIQHRFGVIKDGYDLYGIYAPANIRLGLTYGITKDFTVGLGVTKNKMQYDLEWKYKILGQNKSGFSPVTVTYYGDIARSEAPSSRFKNQTNELKEANRLTFFNELMIARKIDNHLSVQAGVNFAHVNLVDSTTLTHDRMGFSFITRYKFSPQSSVQLIYNTNIMSFDKDFKSLSNPKDPLRADFGIGYEVSTGSHQFQIFLCSADGILNQDIRFFNSNDFFNNQIIFGFNITRQWGF